MSRGLIQSENPSTVPLRPKAGPTRAGGFTFVEIMLVIILLSIIAALAVPNFSTTYKNIQLKKTTEDLMFTMRYAQSRAVNRNAPVRIVFNTTDDQQYWLEEKRTDPQESISAEQSEVFQRFSGRLGRTFHLPPGFRLEPEYSTTQFLPNGRIDPQRIYLCQDDRCFTISTREQRGHVHIFDGKVE